MRNEKAKKSAFVNEWPASASYSHGALRTPKTLPFSTCQNCVYAAIRAGEELVLCRKKSPSLEGRWPAVPRDVRCGEGAPHPERFQRAMRGAEAAHDFGSTLSPLRAHDEPLSMQEGRR